MHFVCSKHAPVKDLTKILLTSVKKLYHYMEIVLIVQWCDELHVERRCWKIFEICIEIQLDLGSMEK